MFFFVKPTRARYKTQARSHYHIKPGNFKIRIHISNKLWNKKTIGKQRTYERELHGRSHRLVEETLTNQTYFTQDPKTKQYK